MAIAKPLTDPSQRKEEKMYDDNLAEFLKYCDEEEDLFCAICLGKLPEVPAVSGICQDCADGIAAAIEHC